MKRKLIAGERIMYVDAATPVNCVFAVKVRGLLREERLRAALLKVQAKHPMLRACIVEDRDQMPWFVLEDSIPQIPLRIVQRTSDNNWIRESQTEWKKLFDVETGPLARMVWIKSEEDEVSELILVCAHCISDGTSFTNLMQEILTLSDDPGKDIGICQSFGTIRELIPEQLLSDKKKILKARFFSFLARIYLSAKSCKPFPDERTDYMIRWKLDKEVSAAIFNRCKTERVSFHAVLSAVFLSAFRITRGRKACNNLICPIDIRRYIKPLRNDTMFAFAPVIKLSLYNNLNADFWVNARKLKGDLSAKVSGLKAQEFLMFSEYFHSSVKRMTKYLRSTRGTHDFTFSNLGKLNIPKSYSSFCVDDIYTPTIAFPWRNSTTIAVSVFRGQVDFAFMSNETFLPFHEAEMIKDKAMTLLLKETSVSFN